MKQTCRHLNSVPPFDECNEKRNITDTESVKTQGGMLKKGIQQSTTVLDSGYHAVDSGFKSLSVELGYWILMVSGILDFLNCIPDSKAQDFRFHKQTFPAFWNLDSLTRGDLDVCFYTVRFYTVFYLSTNISTLRQG